MITIKENNLNLYALSNWDIKGRTVVQLEYTDANVSVYNKIFDNGTEIVLYPEEGKERAAYGVFYNTNPNNSNSKYIYVDTFESVAMAAKYVNDVLLDKLGLVEKLSNKKLKINESKKKSNVIILEAVYNGFDESEFDEHQLDYIRTGIDRGFDISFYADPRYNVDQMKQILYGLESGLDVSIYADPKFDWSQMEEILYGLKSGLNVSLYADPKFDWSQMEEIRNGLKSGVDVSIYADPKFDWSQMREIRYGLESGLDVYKYADPKFNRYQMQEIRNGLKSGVDVSIYADPKFDWYQMQEIRNGLKSGVDVYKYNDFDISSEPKQKYKDTLDKSVNGKFNIEFYIQTRRPTNKRVFNMSNKTITIKCIDYDTGEFDDDIGTEDEYFASDMNATYGAFYELEVNVKMLPEEFESAEEYAYELIGNKAQKAFPEGYSIE